MPATKVAQINLNHARLAQDLLTQVLAERGAGLAVVAEPYRVPANHPSWVVDRTGKAAIFWSGAQHSPPLSLFESGDGFVAAGYGDVYVISVYSSPNDRPAEFSALLDRLAGCAHRCGGRPLIIAGDFNAKSALWGSPRANAQGGEVEAWAAGLGLELINSGRASTCVRAQGESIVDLTWANPLAARRLFGWRVFQEVESLSDHLYMARWVVRQLDGDRLKAALLIATWPPEEFWGGQEVAGRVAWLREAMAQACDAAMPRARGGGVPVGGQPTGGPGRSRSCVASPSAPRDGSCESAGVAGARQKW
ncbi:uncharacterized protein [Temnothorax nylanderi]|uniref:uncharacterized protein n=1 Tax=Temnothorax nylanderi TaxID=102681 RepID=UPI003A8BBA4C